MHSSEQDGIIVNWRDKNEKEKTRTTRQSTKTTRRTQRKDHHHGDMVIRRTLRTIADTDRDGICLQLTRGVMRRYVV